MKRIKIFSLLTLLVITAISATAFISIGSIKTHNGDNKGFAVVELFTSEGCSSCPPADELVARIEKESKDKPVYILAYHVDYWNRLGWKDQFSSADFSKRQNEYASYLHLQSVYTPQIVVNGQQEFVGSEEGTLRIVIKADLQKAPAAGLNLSVIEIGQNKANINYTTDGTDKNSLLLIAVVQKSAQTDVKSGENGGRTLSHVQIVRALQKVPLNGNSGSATVSLPGGFDLQKWEIIGFLQNTGNGSITAAAKAVLPGAFTRNASPVEDNK